jgi:hypothetical protein
MKRREFLQSTGALAPFILALETLGAEPGSPAIADKDVYEFWRTLGDSKTPRVTTSSIFPREPFFVLYYEGQFIAMSDIPDKLLHENGDVKLTVNVDQFKPSTKDLNLVQNMKAGTLRIDLQQTQPLPHLETALAWLAIQALFPQDSAAGKVKAFPDEGKIWGQKQSLPLPGGEGLWTWNFFIQEKESTWFRVLSFLKQFVGLADDPKTAAVLGTVFGLPAVGLVVLQAVNKLIAELQAREAQSKFVFQSNGQPFVATKAARATAGGKAIPIAKNKASYLIIPQEDLKSFSDGIKKASLELKDGFIVPKGTASIDVPTASDSVLKDVTYVVLTANSEQIKV